MAAEPILPLSPSQSDCQKLSKYQHSQIIPIYKKNSACILNTKKNVGKFENCNGSVVTTLWVHCSRKYDEKICKWKHYWKTKVLVCFEQTKSSNSIDYNKWNLKDINQASGFLSKLKSSYNEVKLFGSALVSKKSAIAFVEKYFNVFPKLRSRVVNRKFYTREARNQSDELMEFIFRTNRFAISLVPTSPIIRAIQLEILSHIEIQISQTNDLIKELNTVAE